MIETVLVDCNLVDNQSLRYSGPILESKGMCDFSGKGQNIWKVGLGKNVQNLKIFWKRTGDCVKLSHTVNC